MTETDAAVDRTPEEWLGHGRALLDEHFGQPEAFRLFGDVPPAEQVFGEAADAFQRALALDERQLEAAELLGATLHARGRAEEALALYELVLANLPPDSPAAERLRLRRRRARHLYLQEIVRRSRVVLDDLGKERPRPGLWRRLLDARRPPAPPVVDRAGGPCPACRGTHSCFTCDGTGTWYEGSSREQRCESCDGTGRCPACS